MKIQSRLLAQNLNILLCTVFITTCVSLLFGYLYLEAVKVPIKGGRIETEFILLKNNELLYATKDLSNLQVKDILMDMEMNKAVYQIKGANYTADTEEFRTNAGDGYQLITLTPLVNMDRFYQVLIAFIICAFLVTFIIASLVAQRQNKKTIIQPIVRLRQEAERLSGGELNIEIADEGEGEVRELCQAVELLRLKLKESVYYKEKYDDNRKFLVSSISHDLKTPVTAVRGYLEGILDGVADTPEKREKYLRAALSKTTLISSMIADLLLYSKLDLGQIPFDFEMVELGGYLADSVEDMRFSFETEGKKIALENRMGNQVFVRIDPARFRRVVQNIIDNARKHTQAGTGALDIVLRGDRRQVVLEFRDNGHGIAKEDLPRIFDRFYRADAARRIEGSSGLGLAIAKQMVEGMGGRIWAVSEVGKGTSILISWKRVDV